MRDSDSQASAIKNALLRVCLSRRSFEVVIMIEFVTEEMYGPKSGRAAADTHCSRTKRQLWGYIGSALETHDCGHYRYVRGKLQRNRGRITVRGLSDNYNKDPKNLFKGAAVSASTRPGPLQDSYVALFAKGIGMRPTMARLTLARKIVLDHFTICRRCQVCFDNTSPSTRRRAAIRSNWRSTKSNQGSFLISIHVGNFRSRT